MMKQDKSKDNKIVNMNEYRSNESLQQSFKNYAIHIHKEIIDMHDKSVINYNQYKILLNRLNEIVNDKGDKDE